jgi:hypothetical protein
MSYKLTVKSKPELNEFVLADLKNCPFVVKDSNNEIYLVNEYNGICLMTNVANGLTYDSTTVDQLNKAIKSGTAKIVQVKLDLE